MNNLKHWKNKIQEKRKQTSWRDFLMEISSWYTLSLYNNKGIISRFPDTDRVKNVIPNKKFEENRDNLLELGINYNSETGFFHSFDSLFKNIDMFNSCQYWNNINSNFSESVLNGKNVYLTFAAISDCENVCYSISVKDNCSDVFNSLMIQPNSQDIYFATNVSSSYKVFYSRYIQNSNNIWFSTNLIGCQECIDCDNLENVSYHINNKQYPQEEYFIKKEEILSDKYSFLDKYTSLKIWGNNIGCGNIRKGDALFNCFDISDAKHSFNVKWGKNLIFTGWVQWVEDAYDICGGGSPTSHDIYGVAGVSGDHVYCSSHIIGSNIFYSFYLENCSFCIGCVWLKNKQYCILNKQYTKEQWEILADKIFTQMESDWILWDFFPGNINPYYFNDTIAEMLWDFTKEEVESKWYMWRDEEIKVDIPEWVDIISTEELNDYQWYSPSGEWRINPEILKKVIKDDKWDYYKVVQMEYDFLMKHSLPLPRLHWMDRMKINF